MAVKKIGEAEGYAPPIPQSDVKNLETDLAGKEAKLPTPSADGQVLIGNADGTKAFEELPSGGGGGDVRRYQGNSLSLSNTSKVTIVDDNGAWSFNLKAGKYTYSGFFNISSGDTTDLSCIAYFETDKDMYLLSPFCLQTDGHDNGSAPGYTVPVYGVRGIVSWSQGHNNLAEVGRTIATPSTYMRLGMFLNGILEVPEDLVLTIKLALSSSGYMGIRAYSFIQFTKVA